MSLAVIVVSLLLLRGASQPSVMAQMPDVMPRGQIGGEAGIERAMSLFRVSSRSLARSRLHTAPRAALRAPRYSVLASRSLVTSTHLLTPFVLIPQIWEDAYGLKPDIWEEAYGLKPDVHLPPAKITLPAIVPRAPHLEDCEALTAARKESERRGGDGEPPLWARAVNNCSECNPQPPWVCVSDAGNLPLTRVVQWDLWWEHQLFPLPFSLPCLFPPHLPSRLPSPQPGAQVRGSDADNLPLTRVVQRDLWEHQLFHGSCDGRRLLVVPWPTKTHHGVGSQIHVMSTFLSLALSHNRTLVPAPGSYDRAFTETCNSTKTGGAWGCYFFPIVNPDCERVVSDMTASSTMPPLSSDKVGHNRLAASGDLVVHLNASCDSQMKLEARAAKLWGDAFARAPNVVEYMGEQPPAETNHPVVHWWRSQSTRFMLRWPSPHTCHQINKERHTAYGLLTASHLSRYTETQTEILRAVAGNTSESPESKKLSEISAGPPGPIESQVWTVRGFAGCKETCMSAADAKAIKETYASLGGEPFVMRPIVSVHVRQSDKGTEMRLSPLATHMFFVHRLRRHVPDLRHVWLNTEMESVIRESALYLEWKFLYSSNSRQPVDSRSSRKYEMSQNSQTILPSFLLSHPPSSLCTPARGNHSGGDMGMSVHSQESSNTPYCHTISTSPSREWSLPAATHVAWCHVYVF
ncbi:unnamed protein product [Closterium sp. NIES-64]|nr:unnamed protein product [Closterium sp. NIES-64]